MTNVKINEHELRILRSIQQRLLNENSPRIIRDQILTITMSIFNNWDSSDISVIRDEMLLLENLYELMNDIEYPKEQLNHMRINEHNLPDFIQRSLEQGKIFQLNFENGEVWCYSYSYEQGTGLMSLMYNNESGRNACMEKDKEVSIKVLRDKLIKNWSNVVRIY